MAMGNPLGSVFADILLSHYEVIWLNDCPPEFKPIFYRRYVDDTFLAFKTKDHIQQFHNYVNVKHRSLKFTYDIENNDSLPFIGVLVTKSDCSYISNTDISTSTSMDLLFCILFSLKAGYTITKGKQ